MTEAAKAWLNRWLHDAADELPGCRVLGEPELDAQSLAEVRTVLQCWRDTLTSSFNTVLELGAAADRLEAERDEARRELAESRRIWHEKRDELQAFCDRVAEELRVAKLAEEVWRQQASEARGELAASRASAEIAEKTLNVALRVNSEQARRLELARPALRNAHDTLLGLRRLDEISAEPLHARDEFNEPIAELERARAALEEPFKKVASDA